MKDESGFNAFVLFGFDWEAYLKKSDMLILQNIHYVTHKFISSVLASLTSKTNNADYFIENVLNHFDKKGICIYMMT